MPTLMDSIVDKYIEDESTREFCFIVFVSESPECKMGMFPPIMTLCDFDIEAIGKAILITLLLPSTTNTTCNLFCKC